MGWRELGLGRFALEFQRPILLHFADTEVSEAIFDTVAIVGPGLVGGSLGAAIRERGLAKRVIGIGRRETSLQEALNVGAVDEVTLDLREGVCEADLVVLATPINAFSQIIGHAAGSMKESAILTDVASTKQRVIEVITAALKDRPDVVYIPAHPMSGSEQRSAASADASLFEGSPCILTPLSETPQDELNRVRELWKGVGATVHVMDCEEHDRLVARISHLPHLAAAALLETIYPGEGEMAGAGLLDTTRVASGDPSMWRDICETNAEQISSALESYVEVLERIRALIAGGELDDLEALLGDAKKRRDDLLATREGTDEQQQ